MIENIDSINKNLKETTNHIPKKFKKSGYLNYISKQSFRQIAAINLFNKNNIVFSDKIIPEKVMNDYISFNILSKKKAELENTQQSFDDDKISKDEFERVYEKMENMYTTKISIIQYDSLNPFEKSQTQNIQENRNIFLKNLLQKRNDHESKLKYQDQQNIMQIQEEENLDQPDLENAYKTQNQQDNEVVQEDENYQEIISGKDESYDQHNNESDVKIADQTHNQQNYELIQEDENNQEIISDKDEDQDQYNTESSIKDADQTQNQQIYELDQEDENNQKVISEKDENQDQYETESSRKETDQTKNQQNYKLTQEDENNHEIISEKDEDQNLVDIESSIKETDQVHNQQSYELARENENHQEIISEKDENQDQYETESSIKETDQTQNQQIYESTQEDENNQEIISEKDEDQHRVDIESNIKETDQVHNQQSYELARENENNQEITSEKDENQDQHDDESDIKEIDQKQNKQNYELAQENENNQEIISSKDEIYDQPNNESDIKENDQMPNQQYNELTQEDENQQEKLLTKDQNQYGIESSIKETDQTQNQYNNELTQEAENHQEITSKKDENKINHENREITPSPKRIITDYQNQRKIKSYPEDENQEINLFQDQTKIPIESNRSYLPPTISEYKQQDEIQISTENCFLDKYQLILQNLDLYFKILYRIGYGHFGLLSKELKIENQKEEIAFFSSTAAVIILFRLLHEEDDYARYQNIILTLSNLFVRFNINMIRKNEKSNDNEIQIKESKKFAKYNSFMKNSVEEAISQLEPFYIEYLKHIDVEDFMNVLEVRCAFDNWLLSSKNLKRVEIPFEFLTPSKFSQYDLKISSCLIEHKDFSEEMKPRINDFAYLFTYLNIIDGLDKRIIINEWTKPEIEKIKNALLNFGSSSVSNLQFIAKTCIITKSLRSIVNFIDKIVKLLNNEKRQIDIDGFDEKIMNKINFNTNVYEKSKDALSFGKNNIFNSKEIEFIKLLLSNGIQYFDEIFLDKKYNFKDIKFTNFDEFVNCIVRIE